MSNFEKWKQARDTKRENVKQHSTIKRAIEQGDSLSLLKIATYLRFSKGMNYREILDLFNGISPLTISEYDDHMQEGELLEQLPDGADVEGL